MTDLGWLSLDEGETVEWHGKPRVRSIFKAIAFVAAAVVGVGVAVDLPAAVAATLLGAVLVGWQYLRLLNTDYVLTTEAVYRRTSVLGESINRVPLSKIQNTDLSKGVLGNRFDFGTVSVSSAGDTNDLRVANVNDPEQFRDRLDALSARFGGDGTGGGGRRVEAVDLGDLHAEARALREAAEELRELTTGESGEGDGTGGTGG